VRVADVGPVDAITDLAALISLCAQLRADGLPGDGEAWAATASRLNGGERPRPGQLEQALEAHARFVG
jgi:hypothetical protein